MSDSKRPDDLMEAAKREAAKIPDTEILVDLSENEVFKVTYVSTSDSFNCSRKFKTNQG